MQRIFAAKGRPTGHPLIVHVATADRVAAWTTAKGRQGERLALLAEAFWPGPLTVIVDRSGLVAAEVVGGRDTIGLRVPDHPVATAMLTAFGGGVAAPSANRFGKVSPTTAAHVASDLGSAVDLILEGGPSRVGLESTIVELVSDAPTLLRPGAVTATQLAEALGEAVVDGRSGESRASGMLASHYAPAAQVALASAETVPDAVSAHRGAGRTVGIIAPSRAGLAGEEAEAVWVLPDDADAYGHRLYDSLRAVDRAGVDVVLIVPPARGDLLAAVLDRLTKAAGPRPD